MGEFGFFKLSTLNRPTHLRLPLIAPRCGECGLWRSCKSPKMKVSGEGRKKVLICGEGPGETEDEQGLQFVGSAGEVLERLAKQIGLDLRKDCWLVNAINCRATDKKGKNRNPTPKEVDFCRPLTLRAIRDLNPEVILVLGSHAVRSVIASIWPGNPGGITRWEGWKIPCRKPSSWICPMRHPAAVLYDDTGVTERQLLKHLKAIGPLIGTRPTPPKADEGDEVWVVEDPVWAAEMIREFTKQGKPIAFDYESLSLKPHRKDTQILCCAVSDGETTVAYPWLGEAVGATKDLLRAPVPKVGWSIGFEQSWCMEKLGIEVNNWALDGMHAAHTLDGRAGITSLEFQAFVRLGVMPYKEFKDYMKAPLEEKEGGNALNRLDKDVEKKALYTYCGKDALLERRLADILAPLVGVNLNGRKR